MSMTDEPESAESDARSLEQDTPTSFTDHVVGIAAELRPLARLATPVVIAELGWVAMGLVDILMVGKLGPEELTAVGIGHAILSGTFIVGMGILLALDTLSSQAHGAGRDDLVRRYLWHGVTLAVVLSPLAIGLTLVGRPMLGMLQVRPEYINSTLEYIGSASWSLPPMLFYTVFRRHLQAIGVVLPITMALILSNGINLIANDALIFGHFGMPALGVAGAGWATVVSRVTMALLLYLVAFGSCWWRPWRYWAILGPFRAWFDSAIYRQFLRLGLPISGQLMMEVGVFGLATGLSGKLIASEAAAHQIALSLASFTFMIPLGISAAAAVRVGNAIGAGQPVRAARAGWSALVVGVACSLISAAVFVLLPRTLVGAFSGDAETIAVAVGLLWLAALFQLWDGIQVIATGALRGAGDTSMAMFSNMTAHWFVGLPVGYLLCFTYGWGIRGLWIGLSLGLFLVGLTLIFWWARTVSRFASVVVVDKAISCNDKADGVISDHDRRASKVPTSDPVQV